MAIFSPVLAACLCLHRTYVGFEGEDLLVDRVSPSQPPLLLLLPGFCAVLLVVPGDMIQTRVPSQGLVWDKEPPL